MGKQTQILMGLKVMMYIDPRTQALGPEHDAWARGSADVWVGG